jgi:hypothetical protein
MKKTASEKLEILQSLAIREEGGRVGTELTKRFVKLMKDILFTTCGVMLRGQSVWCTWDVFKPHN